MSPAGGGGPLERAGGGWGCFAFHPPPLPPRGTLFHQLSPSNMNYELRAICSLCPGCGFHRHDNYALQIFPLSLSAIASMKPSVFTLRLEGFLSASKSRSPVMMPASTVWSAAASSASANSMTAGVPSSSPRLRSPPVQAKMSAMEFDEVSSPLRCL